MLCFGVGSLRDRRGGPVIATQQIQRAAGVSMTPMGVILRSAFTGVATGERGCGPLKRQPLAHAIDPTFLMEQRRQGRCYRTGHLHTILASPNSCCSHNDRFRRPPGPRRKKASVKLTTSASSPLAGVVLFATGFAIIEAGGPISLSQFRVLALSRR